MTIGTKIRQERTEKRMSQRLLADLIGVAQSTIHNWESDSSCPTGEEIKKLADALEVPIYQLFNECTPLQPTKDSAPSYGHDIHQPTQFTNYEELVAIQKEVIQLQKARIVSLEEENTRLKNQQA